MKIFWKYFNFPIPLMLIFIGLINPIISEGKINTGKMEKQVETPNILLILADDMTWRDMESYGNPDVKTPNIAKLASQGMTFQGMYTSTAMCSPSRQQLYTGMYPVRNGAYPNHSETYEGVRSLPHHLNSLGYRVGLVGKRHFGPSSSFPFQFVGNSDDIEKENIEAVDQFINKNINQPFALVIGSHQPHRPWDKGNSEEYDVEEISVPPHLIDTPTTRQQMVKYYAEITHLDRQVGKILEILEDSGQEDETLVIFTSEQGSFFPFAKWTCYEDGLKTGFIARWPGKINPGTQNQALLQYVDVIPTLVEIAGGNPDTVHTGRPDVHGEAGFDGKSFLSVLLNNEQHFRDYVYGVHTTLGIIGAEEPYPIRSVNNGRYKLIRNLNAKAEFANITRTERGREIIESWQKAGGSNSNILYRVQSYYKRPTIEFYDLKKDPNELHNLAGDPKYNKLVKELDHKLTAWMLQQGDEGMATERRASNRMSD